VAGDDATGKVNRSAVSQQGWGMVARCSRNWRDCLACFFDPVVCCGLPAGFSRLVGAELVVGGWRL
jgi:hypothetical protein